MVSRECTWCRFLRSFYGRDLAKELENYIASLPEDIKVSEEEHARRMALCASCEGNRNGLCRYCGCFVAARTAKKDLGCPYPADPRW